MHLCLPLLLRYVYGTLVMSCCSSCPFSSAYDTISCGTFVLLYCSKTNITLQQNQCPIDTVNTPRILVETNTGCVIMSVSHTPNQARLRTLIQYPVLWFLSTARVTCLYFVYLIKLDRVGRVDNRPSPG